MNIYIQGAEIDMEIVEGVKILFPHPELWFLEQYFKHLNRANNVF